MSDNNNETLDTNTLYTLADKFIDLANELSKQENPTSSVGTAFRYAATRFSAFEASTIASNLAKEKDAVKAALLKDYEHMLEENLQAYIRHLEAQTKQE